jgi:hypothetical protein
MVDVAAGRSVLSSPAHIHRHHSQYDIRSASLPATRKAEGSLLVRKKKTTATTGRPAAKKGELRSGHSKVNKRPLHGVLGEHRGQGRRREQRAGGGCVRFYCGGKNREEGGPLFCRWNGGQEEKTFDSKRTSPCFAEAPSVSSSFESYGLDLLWSASGAALTFSYPAAAICDLSPSSFAVAKGPEIAR